MNKVNVVAITDLEHTAPRISNFLYYLDSKKFIPHIIGSDYKNYLSDEDLPNKFSKKVKLHLFDRKFNFFSFLKRNIEDKAFVNKEQKKSKIYLFFRKIIINFLLNINFPDQYIFTANKYIKIFNSIDFNGKIILISSSPYPTYHAVARRIKANSKKNILWIADYRDLWSYNSNYIYNNLRFALERQYELSVMKTADIVTTVSKPWADIQSNFLKREVIVIPNGYTEIESYNKNSNKTIRLEREGDKIYILYVGAIYFDSQDVDLFFESLKDQNIDNFEIHFIGRFSVQLEHLIKKNKMEKYVKQIGKFSRSESQSLQNSYDFLLFFDLKFDEGWVLLKFYEYIGANKPIICIGGNESSAHKKILFELNRGFTLTNKNQIDTFFKSINKISIGEINFENTSKFSYRTQTKKLETIFNKLIKH
jgi:hypothetical protein